MDIFEYIDQLDEIVDGATKIPFIGKVLVDADSVFDIIDAIKENLPREITDAQYTLSERDRIVAEANARASKAIEEAKEEIERMVQEHEIVRLAKTESNEIIERTKVAAAEIREGANVYANDILYQLEGNLDKALYTVKKSREELKGMNQRQAVEDPVEAK